MAISVRVDPERLAAPAGSDVDGAIVVTNPLDEQVHVRVVVSGEVAGWSSVEPADLWLPAGGTVRCALRFRLPRGAPGGVGEVPFLVRVLSDHDGAGGATAEARLAVEGQAELALRIAPGAVRGTVSATVKVAADNLGSVPARAQLHVDTADDVDAAVEPDSIILEPGETTWAKVTVRPRRRFAVGAPRQHDYWVRLEPLGGARVSVQGHMHQRSLVAGFLPRVALALAAFVILAFGAAKLFDDDGGTTLGTDATLPTTIPTTTTTVVADTTPPAPAAGVPTTSTTVPFAQRRIAFQSKRDGNFEIYVSKQDGNEAVNLTLNAAHDSEPAWSPDGTRLAFDSDRSGNFDIWVMNADGTNPVQLTTELAPDGYPTWSPDGSQLAFVSFRDGNSEIYVMNADGTAQTRITKAPSAEGKPSWAPDGSRIAFHTDRDGNYEIYVMGVDGSAPLNLSNNPGFDQNPAWSPNSARLAFDSTRDGGKAELYLMGGDGTLPIRLTTNDFTDKWPEWSADGGRIAYQSDGSGDLELFTVGSGGGQPRRVTDVPGEDAEPSWQRAR